MIFGSITSPTVDFNKNILSGTPPVVQVLMVVLVLIPWIERLEIMVMLLLAPSVKKDEYNAVEN